MNKNKALASIKMYVHGGRDFKDEKAELFNYGHPILTIVTPNGNQHHFKCTSVDIEHSTKLETYRNKFYQFKNPEACQLDKTYKAVKQPGFAPVVDFNHSVYLLNDETPPLHVYLDDNAEQHSWQTQFELSDEDKLGIIKKIQSLTVDNKFSRPPVVSKEECDEVSQKWLETHPWHRIHSIQVVEYMTEIEKYSLDIDDLEDNMDKSNSL